MNKEFIIKTLADVQRVAESIGIKCAVSVDPVTQGFGERDNGDRVIRLIVGWKKNLAYNPNEVVGTIKGTPRIPDVRILALRANMTANELVEKYLANIKKSLENSEILAPEIEKPKGETVHIPTDAELAAGLEKGKGIVAGEEAWGDVVPSWSDVPKTETEDVAPMFAPEKQNDDREILEAISILGQNMANLSEDLKNINTRLVRIEKKKRRPSGIPAQKVNEDK